MSLLAHLQVLSSIDPHCYYMEYESYDAMQASILFDAPPIRSLSTLLKTVLWAKIQDVEDIALIPPNENNMSLLFSHGKECCRTNANVSDAIRCWSRSWRPTKKTIPIQIHGTLRL